MIESKMHAPVVLNLSNSLWKIDKMLDKTRILSNFPNSFNKSIKHEHSCQSLYSKYLHVLGNLTFSDYYFIISVWGRSSKMKKKLNNLKTCFLN